MEECHVYVAQDDKGQDDRGGKIVLRICVSEISVAYSVSV